MKEYKIASIAGDGIGQEVVPEAHKVLKKVAEEHQFKLSIDDFDFASCDYYEKHGKMLPDDWKDKIGKHDAIFFGAVGMPDRYPCLLYTSPSPRDISGSRMPSSA